MPRWVDYDIPVGIRGIRINTPKIIPNQPVGRRSLHYLLPIAIAPLRAKSCFEGLVAQLHHRVGLHDS